MAENLDDAIAEAKVAAGLEADQKYPASMFHEHIEERWQRPFWERAVDRVIAEEPMLQQEPTSTDKREPMSSHHSVTVTTRPEPDPDMGGTRRVVDRIEFACTGADDAHCRTYPRCDCDEWTCEHPRVAGQPCFMALWFKGEGAVYVGDDYDDMRDDCVPAIDRSGPITYSFKDDYPEWNWAEGQATT